MQINYKLIRKACEFRMNIHLNSKLFSKSDWVSDCHWGATQSGLFGQTAFGVRGTYEIDDNY